MAIQVSTKWKEAIKAQFRYPGYIKAVLTVAPPGMREGATSSTTYTESITSTEQITNGESYMREPVATFERDRWIGDGSMYLPSEVSNQNKAIEWWSNTVNFSSESPVVIDITFDTTYTIPGMYILWDTETNSWPTDWIVKGYNVYGELIDEYHVTDTNSYESYTDAPFDDIKSMKLIFNSWSKPEWRVRINEITFGLYVGLNNDAVQSAEFSASSPLTAEDLPTYSFSMTVNNYDKSFDPKLQNGYSKYLAQRQQVKIQWGFETERGRIEWMDIWPMYLYEWTIPSDAPEVQFTAGSRNDFITNDYIAGKYDGQKHNFYDIAVHILENSGIIKETNSEIPWEIDTALKSMYTRAPMPVSATNLLLQLIANACSCIYDTNPQNGYIRLRSSVVDTDYEIGMQQQIGDPAFEIQDRLKSLRIGIHTFREHSEVEEQYKSELMLSGTTRIEAHFNNIIIEPQVSATNATVSIVATYARAMVLDVTPSNPSSSVTVVVNGRLVEESTTFIETYNNPEVANGLEIEVDNALVTEMDTVASLTEFLVLYYSRRNHLQIPYLGYPELEVGDRITVPNKYGQSDGDIVGLSLTFNGGFSGTVDVIAKE